MKAELDNMIADPASAKVLTQEEKDAAKREAVRKAAEKKRLEEERKLQEENAYLRGEKWAERHRAQEDVKEELRNWKEQVSN